MHHCVCQYVTELSRQMRSSQTSDVQWNESHVFISNSSLKAFMRHCIRTKMDTQGMSVLINGFNAPLCHGKLATWKIYHLHIIVIHKESNFKLLSLLFFSPIMTKWHTTHSKIKTKKCLILYIRVCTSSSVLRPR